MRTAGRAAQRAAPARPGVAGAAGWVRRPGRAAPASPGMCGSGRTGLWWGKGSWSEMGQREGCRAQVWVRASKGRQEEAGTGMGCDIQRERTNTQRRRSRGEEKGLSRKGQTFRERDKDPQSEGN